MRGRYFASHSFPIFEVQRALQYSQYAGYHPDWCQSIMAITRGLDPGDTMTLLGCRSACVKTIGTSSGRKGRFGCGDLFRSCLRGPYEEVNQSWNSETPENGPAVGEQVLSKMMSSSGCLPIWPRGLLKRLSRRSNICLTIDDRYYPLKRQFRELLFSGINLPMKGESKSCSRPRHATIMHRSCLHITSLSSSFKPSQLFSRVTPSISSI
jgi:hypothetical protein